MTLKDVALKANCSVSTASKALKNSSEISEEAKQRILSVAKECGYFKKATTRTAVLGGFKTVIFNDVKGDSVSLFDEFKKLAKKQNLTAIYVSMSEKDSLELLNQIGAYGLVLNGSKNISKDKDKVFVLQKSPDEAKDFLKEISEYMPERPSRATSPERKVKVSAEKQSSKTPAVKIEKTLKKPKQEKPMQKKEEPTPQKKEEIWLL